MKIYCVHASLFDYENEFYQCLRSSNIYCQHQFILPHHQNTKPIISLPVIHECDRILAEISYPSTGMGIELGWGHMAHKPILGQFL